jgi:hypothetical protein
MSELAVAQQNPFQAQRTAPSNAIADATAMREAQEVQAMMVIAKRFPRDPVQAMDNILQSFTRPTLAEGALYSYSKGGTDVTGPSIRSAEAIAQMWGNLQFGIRELEQRDGESTVEAFAWDIESNTRQIKVFQVPHIRYTRRGSYKLDDPREVYELVANQGARRLRACILGIIPGDVVEAAMRQAETTLATTADTSPEGIAKMLRVFERFGVTKEMIEKRMQRRIDAITPALVVQFEKIATSMRDGMSVAADWFDVDPAGPAAEAGAETSTKETPTYPQDQFDKNLPKWKKLIESGKNTADEVIATASAKGALTDDQKKAIHAIKKIEQATPAASSVIDALRKRAEDAAIAEAEISKHLGVETLDGISTAQVEAAIAFINNPMGD